MKSDEFFDAMGEIDEKYIVVKLRIPRLHLSKRIVLSAIICFAVFYLLSSTLFALLLPDITDYSLLEGQLRQLAVLVINALIGACSVPILRRVIKRDDYLSYVVLSAILFIVVLIIGYLLFYYYYPAQLQSGNDNSLWWHIAILFPQMIQTAFALPALIAQVVTLFVVKKFFDTPHG